MRVNIFIKINKNNIEICLEKFDKKSIIKLSQIANDNGGTSYER